jgi:WD40 repeat protein
MMNISEILSDPSTLRNYNLNALAKVMNLIKNHLDMYKTDLITLPLELLYIIYSYLNVNDFIASLLVSKRWNQVLDRQEFYILFCEKLMGKAIPIHDTTKDFRAILRTEYIVEQNWKYGRYYGDAFEAHSMNIYCIDIQGEKLFTGSRDTKIRIWNLNNLQLLLELNGHRGSVLCIKSNESFVISGSSDHTIIIWNAFTGALEAKLNGHMDSVLNIALAGNYIVSASKDKTIRMWDLSKKECLHVYNGHQLSVNGIAYKNGIICSGSLDKTIRLWDSHGNHLHTLHAHERGISSLDFDGKYIVSGSFGIYRVD